MSLGSVITPNIPESETLWGKPIYTQEDMIEAAECIYKMTGTAVLLKGGHLKGDALEIIKGMSGTKLDPDLTSVFIDIMNKEFDNMSGELPNQ